MRRSGFKLIIVIVLVFGIGLCGCAEEEDLSITPNISSDTPSQEDDKERVVITDDEDDISPLEGAGLDYSLKANWLVRPEADFDKEVDTFYIYPTVYIDADEEAPQVQDQITDEQRELAREAYDRQGTLFEQCTNVYSAFYRQTNLTEFASLAPDEVESFQMGQQRTDIYAALDYYFSNYNSGRPFILAGHSQGAMMVKIVLEEYMRVHPDIYSRMVAAYVVGWSVTESDLEDYDHLKFAESEDDTGVILSWNTEGEKNGDNYVVLDGAISINPISFSLEDEKAEASQNLGSRLYNEDEETYEIKANLADAKIDPKRGTVICKTNAVEYDDIPGGLLGKKSYHSHDFDLFYENIRHNLLQRVDAYLLTEVEDS